VQEGLSSGRRENYFFPSVGSLKKVEEWKSKSAWNMQRWTGEGTVFWALEKEDPDKLACYCPSSEKPKPGP